MDCSRSCRRCVQRMSRVDIGARYALCVLRHGVHQLYALRSETRGDIELTWLRGEDKDTATRRLESGNTKQISTQSTHTAPQKRGPKWTKP